jgi:hypothetical protein
MTSTMKTIQPPGSDHRDAPPPGQCVLWSGITVSPSPPLVIREFQHMLTQTVDGLFEPVSSSACKVNAISMRYRFWVPPESVRVAVTTR